MLVLTSWTSCDSQGNVPYGHWVNSPSDKMRQKTLGIGQVECTAILVGFLNWDFKPGDPFKIPFISSFWKPVTFMNKNRTLIDRNYGVLNQYHLKCYFFYQNAFHIIGDREIKSVEMDYFTRQVDLIVFCHDQCWLILILPIIHELSWICIYFSVQVSVIKFDFSQEQGNELNKRGIMKNNRW